MSLSDPRTFVVRDAAMVGYPELERCPSPKGTLFGKEKGPFQRTAIHNLLERLFRAAAKGPGETQGPDRNLLGGIIAPGDRVVIKPNWVSHRNGSGKGLDCLVTHASVLAAVLDYVLEARPGSIVVGDAPIQGCDYDKLMQSAGYATLQEEYDGREAPIKWADFRRTCLGAGWANRRRELRPEDAYTLVDLAGHSLLEPIAKDAERFRVTMYSPDLMRETHAPGRHQYLIAREILDANVIISLPKLKTHKKAGITGALKNVVGINGNKDYLPHHRFGGSGGGGDCYQGHSRLKLIGEHLLDAANRRSGGVGRTLRSLSQASVRLAAALGQDPEIEGGWHGNDTIWRTCVDLNRILIFARTDGTLASEPQRRLLTITDAVICGEGEGPLSPTPKPLGILTCALNPLAADFVHAHLMGFDWRRIPLIREAFGVRDLPLARFNPSAIQINYNGRLWTQPWSEWTGEGFRAPTGWRGWCESTTSSRIL